MKYSIAQFDMTDSQISKFKILVKKPKDCVINALQLIDMIDQKTADICRLLVGDIGITKDQIENVLGYMEPVYKWNFYGYSRIESLADISNNVLQINKAMFCGFEGHVFLIAKDKNGNILHIDPQRTGKEICKLNQDENMNIDNECLSYITNKRKYYVLQYTDNINIKRKGFRRQVDIKGLKRSFSDYQKKIDMFYEKSLKRSVSSVVSKRNTFKKTKN